MRTRLRARTASRSELRDRPRRAASSSSLGSRSPGRRRPATIISLIFSIASSVTAMAPPSPRLAPQAASRRQPVEARRVRAEHLGALRVAQALDERTRERDDLAVGGGDGTDRPVRAEQQPPRPEALEQVVSVGRDGLDRAAIPGLGDEARELAADVLELGQAGDPRPPRLELAGGDRR